MLIKNFYANNFNMKTEKNVNYILALSACYTRTLNNAFNILKSHFFRSR